MLKPDFTRQYRRDEKRLLKKHIDLTPLDEVMHLILEDTEESRSELTRRYGAHVLRGRWSGSNECHVANTGDWLLIWMTGNGIAVFQRTRTHDELFR